MLFFIIFFINDNFLIWGFWVLNDFSLFELQQEVKPQKDKSFGIREGDYEFLIIIIITNHSIVIFDRDNDNDGENEVESSFDQSKRVSDKAQKRNSP